MFKIIQIFFANKPSHQYKTDFSVSFYWEDFKKTYFDIKFITSRTRTSNHDIR